ncbi:MAG TPA: ABC transporter substrate-binding protein [Xanthobacteraceae bacterium]|nr:ABC transporter substrate-binding protein [Xanthobacteraceae bacterium]
MSHPHPTARIAALLGLAMLAAALAPAGPAGAAEPTLLRINSFPNAKALPLQVGIGKGFFAKRGLKAELELTESSKAQREGLSAGKFQIAQSAIDNAVAMIEGAHQDVVILSGGDSGMNEFFVQPGIASFAALRGHVILVDAPDTAYALQVKKLLAQHGVEPGGYTVKPAGAGVYRFKAMVDDKSNAAAILNLPFTVEAAQAGMKSLGRTIDLLGPYQAAGGFALRPWAEQNRDTVERYLAAYVESLRWIRDPGHRAEAVGLLVSEQKLARDIAERTYEQLVDPAFGFTPDARFDMEGFHNMMALRAEVEGTTTVAPERYLDLSYYERAMELVGR